MLSGVVVTIWIPAVCLKHQLCRWIVAMPNADDCWSPFGQPVTFSQGPGQQYSQAKWSTKSWQAQPGRVICNAKSLTILCKYTNSISTMLYFKYLIYPGHIQSDSSWVFWLMLLLVTCDRDRADGLQAAARWMRDTLFLVLHSGGAGLILGLRPANEGRCYFVKTSLIGWVQTYYQPCGGRAHLKVCVE